MAEIPEWLYDEDRTEGTDYADQKEAAAYAERSRSQDRDAVNDFILNFLQLDADKTVLDLGSGFGSFAMAAAPHCKKVYAVDISPTMVNLGAQIAEKRGLSNVEFHVGGFLTYEHAGPLVDGVVCCNALHHLPDFWKQVALNRMAAMIEPHGKLHLEDHALSFDMDRYAEMLDDLLERNKERRDASGRNIMGILMREEFPTFGWVMESMLERAGFTILNKRYGKTGFSAFFQCEKREA